MAQIDDRGVSTDSLDDYRTLLRTRFQQAFGSDLALDPETPQGEIIGILALTLAEADEDIAAIANGVFATCGARRLLDRLGSLLRLYRLAATKSTVTVACTGVAGTVIPAGSRVADEHGTQFQSLAAATIASGGSVNVDFESVEAGAIEAAASTLTRITTTSQWMETATMQLQRRQDATERPIESSVNDSLTRPQDSQDHS